MLRCGIAKTHANHFDSASCRTQRRPLQTGRHFIEVHRKQPLANHGPEKLRRKRLSANASNTEWAELIAIVVADDGAQLTTLIDP